MPLRTVFLFFSAYSLLAMANALRPDSRDSSAEKVNETRIVGGQEAPRGKLNFVAGLWTKGGGFPFCGGSLIASSWVLTAAHCVHGKRADSLRVVLGDHDVKAKDPGQTERDVCRVVAHPRYDKPTITNDVALLRLCKDVAFNNYVQPIALNRADIRVVHRQPVYVAGWGTTAEGGKVARLLRFVTALALDNSACRKSYPWISAGQLCAGVDGGGRDACQGDSGGPLWAVRRNSPVLVGVVSSGNGCARPGFPGIYARVSHYFDFVLDTMAAYA